LKTLGVCFDIGDKLNAKILEMSFRLPEQILNFRFSLYHMKKWQGSAAKLVYYLGGTKKHCGLEAFVV